MAQFGREGGQELGNIGELGGKRRHGGYFGSGDAVLFEERVDVAEALRGVRNAHQAVLKCIAADGSYRGDRQTGRCAVRQDAGRRCLQQQRQSDFF